jgi:hypothetical protein
MFKIQPLKNFKYNFFLVTKLLTLMLFLLIIIQLMIVDPIVEAKNIDIAKKE